MDKRVTLNVVEKRGAQRVKFRKLEDDITRKASPTTTGGPDELNCIPQERGPWTGTCGSPVLKDEYGVAWNPDTGGEVVTSYEHWTWDAGVGTKEFLAHPVSAGAYAFTKTAVCEAPNDGGGPAAPSACHVFAPTGVPSGAMTATAGTVYRVSIVHTHYSPTYRISVKFTDDVGTNLGYGVVVPTATYGDGWFTHTADLLAPAGTTRMEIVKDTGNPTLSTAVFFDEVTISTVVTIDAPPPAAVLGGKQINSTGCRASSTQYTVYYEASNILRVTVDGLVMPPGSWTFVAPQTVVFTDPIDVDADVRILYIA